MELEQGDCQVWDKGTIDRQIRDNAAYYVSLSLSLWLSFQPLSPQHVRGSGKVDPQRKATLH